MAETAAFNKDTAVDDPRFERLKKPRKKSMLLRNRIMFFNAAVIGSFGVCVLVVALLSRTKEGAILGIVLVICGVLGVLAAKLSDIVDRDTMNQYLRDRRRR